MGEEHEPQAFFSLDEGEWMPIGEAELIGPENTVGMYVDHGLIEDLEHTGEICINVSGSMKAFARSLRKVNIAFRRITDSKYRRNGDKALTRSRANTKHKRYKHGRTVRTWK